MRMKVFRTVAVVLFGFIALLLVPTPSFAASYEFNWEPVTTNSDGAELPPGKVTYLLRQSIDGGPYVLRAETGQLKMTRDLSPGKHCWTVQVRFVPEVPVATVAWELSEVSDPPHCFDVSDTPPPIAAQRPAGSRVTARPAGG